MIKVGVILVIILFLVSCANNDVGSVYVKKTGQATASGTSGSGGSEECGLADIVAACSTTCSGSSGSAYTTCYSACFSACVDGLCDGLGITPTVSGSSATFSLGTTPTTVSISGPYGSYVVAETSSGELTVDLSFVVDPSSSFTYTVEDGQGTTHGCFELE